VEKMLSSEIFEFSGQVEILSQKFPQFVVYCPKNSNSKETDKKISALLWGFIFRTIKWRWKDGGIFSAFSELLQRFETSPINEINSRAVGV
jgi:hypothetical protein